MNISYPFPIGIPSHWSRSEQLQIPDACLKNWLLDTGSLTERLQSQCREFSLTLVGQRQAHITLEEFQQISQPNQTLNESEWQIREVILWGDDQPWVFARSVIPQTLCENDFANLNNRPLGRLIFNDDRFKRQPFQLTNMIESKTFLAHLDISGDKSLWGRRSIFHFEQLKMIVAEVFLPASPAYKNMG